MRMPITNQCKESKLLQVFKPRTDLIDLDSDPANKNRFDDFLKLVRERFELDHVAYAGMNPINGSVYGHVTYSEDWQKHYVDNGYHLIDPTLQGARRSIAPIDWRRLERGKHFQTVFKDAREFGISERGITIPVRGPYGDIGGLSLTRDCSIREWDMLKSQNMSELQSVAVHVHDMVIRSETVSRLLNSPALSNRETEIMQWTAAGKSQQDIGDILSISHRTVEVHLRSARQKLYALTTPQAVGRAIAMGMIYPE